MEADTIPVRARISGVPSPIRMGLRSDGGVAALVGRLPFLKIGEQLCFDTPGSPPDATARAAHIAGVGLEVDPSDGVPHLVVRLTRRAPEVLEGHGTSRRNAERIEQAALFVASLVMALGAFLAGYLL